MTAPTRPASAPATAAARPDLRLITAPAFLAGGAVWVGAAVIGGADGTARFYLSEAFWLLAHLLLLAGTLGLWQLRPHGDRRSGPVGLGAAAVGRIVFTVAEIVSIATARTADALYPPAALLTAVGMVVAGAAVLRASRWHGPARFAPLVAGLFPFAFMFPLVATGADGPPAISLAGWGVTFVLVGVAARTEAAR